MPHNTVMYRAILQAFLKEHDISSVVDFGCGDWQSSKLIDWSGIYYQGIDCVDSVVMENHKKYGSKSILFSTFMLDDVCAELLIVKDVFQHWYATDVCTFLDKFASKFKYILITNTSVGETVVGPFGMRPMSAKTYPLNLYNPKIIATITTTETKEISLIS